MGKINIYAYSIIQFVNLTGELIFFLISFIKIPSEIEISDLLANSIFLFKIWYPLMATGYLMLTL